MMDAFLETSALIDLAFKDTKTKQRVLGFCSGRKITSKYVLFEVCRGYLRNLILLHNKALTLSTFDELFTYLNNVRRKAYLAGAITEMFQKYFAEGCRNKSIPPPENMSQGEYMLRHFRGFLRKQIRYNWTQIPKRLDEVVDLVRCKDAVEDPYLDIDGLFQQELRKDQCGIASACGLKTFAQQHKHSLVRIRDHLRTLPKPDKETTQRIKSLRELYRVPNANFHKNDCYCSGDALIVQESPDSCLVISKNRKHIGPICGVLGKKPQFC